MNLTLRPVSGLHGELRVPGDKSITHRALLLAALAQGSSRIDHYLDGGDCRATMGCLRGLGVEIAQDGPEALVVQGPGLHGWREPEDVLDCVRSGTTMRLMAGLLAGQGFHSVLRGEPQLRRRPMDRVVEPLRRMGAHIAGRQGGSFPPLSILPAGLHGIEYALPVASAQVKSCVLLAGLYAEGQTTVVEPLPSRDHTERMLRARGVAVHSKGLRHTLEGPAQALDRLDTHVPGDLSSAAFFVVAALLLPGSALRVRDVGVNPGRTGLLDVLGAMGAEITLLDAREEGGEPVADLLVRASELRGGLVDGALVPRMVDEFPILALAATQARGVTQVRGAAELRVKETDRIANIVDGLRALGARIEAHPDGFDIEGPTPLHGAEVDPHGDHRLAMTYAIAGLLAQGETVVRGAECIADSFPGFVETLGTVAEGAVQ
ncbi:MAG: 3-phosphoshikimate 1-carboxyvinyltransferase [Anaerolineae bacterium]